MADVKAVAEGSVALRAFAALWGRFRAACGRLVLLARRIDAAAGDVRMAPPDPADEARVREVLAGSRLVRAIDAAIDVPPRAWRSSSLRAWLDPMWREFRSQSAAGQVRVAGWVLLIATVTHIALVAAFGEAVGWPTWAAWLSCVALLCVPTFASQGVVAAWANRSPWVRRLLKESQPWQ
ncbi:MAG: hypothetical protein LAO77_19510 [Acidobacteriia bacterium]|nr:hypothetical protein [Terriglobia bacterium]